MGKRTKPAAGDGEASAKKSKAGVAVGDDMPSFELETDESTPEDPKLLSSADMVKDHGAIIFFYPKANTGGCTKQACGFRDNADKLEAAGYHVYGMSADKPKSQASWKAKYSWGFTLLSDPSFEVLKAFGVARGDKGINRSHVIVGKGGKVEDVQIGIKPGDSVSEAVKKVLGESTTV